MLRRTAPAAVVLSLSGCGSTPEAVVAVVPDVSGPWERSHGARTSGTIAMAASAHAPCRPVVEARVGGDLATLVAAVPHRPDLGVGLLEARAIGEDQAAAVGRPLRVRVPAPGRRVVGEPDDRPFALLGTAAVGRDGRQVDEG